MIRKLAAAIGLSMLPIGLGIGYYVVEHAWQPDLVVKSRVFAIFMIGVGIFFAVMGPILVIAWLENRLRLKKARAALASGDFRTVYAKLQPMLSWTTCSQQPLATEALALLRDMYRQAQIETSIDEVAELHESYFELYQAHHDGEGIVHDKSVKAELDDIFRRCRELGDNLPAP